MMNNNNIEILAKATWESKYSHDLDSDYHCFLRGYKYNYKVLGEKGLSEENTIELLNKLNEEYKQRYFTYYLTANMYVDNNKERLTDEYHMMADLASLADHDAYYTIFFYFEKQSYYFLYDVFLGDDNNSTLNPMIPDMEQRINDIAIEKKTFDLLFLPVFEEYFEENNDVNAKRFIINHNDKEEKYSGLIVNNRIHNYYGIEEIRKIRNGLFRIANDIIISKKLPAFLKNDYESIKNYYMSFCKNTSNKERMEQYVYSHLAFCYSYLASRISIFDNDLFFTKIYSQNDFNHMNYRWVSLTDREPPEI